MSHLSLPFCIPVSSHEQHYAVALFSQIRRVGWNNCGQYQASPKLTLFSIAVVSMRARFWDRLTSSVAFSFSQDTLLHFAYEAVYFKSLSREKESAEVCMADLLADRV